MKGYIQIKVNKVNLMYRRAANQNESDSSMTYKPQETLLMLLAFLDLKEAGDISLITFCHMKQLTHVSKCLYFQCLK